jgi:chromosome segregation ATPase
VRLESVLDADPNAVRDAPMVDELREQVAYLREQLRREQDAHTEARRTIAELVQRVPELEAAPQEQRDAPKTVEEEPDRAPVRCGRVSGGRTEPWWRVFGG